MTMPLSSPDTFATRTEVVPVAEAGDFLRGLPGWLATALENGPGYVPAKVHEAGVVLTELLANAAKHAPGPYAVTVTQRVSVLRMEVRDGEGLGRTPWSIGKGLLVVGGLCPNRGVLDHGTAKTAWAELPILVS